MPIKLHEDIPNCYLTRTRMFGKKRPKGHDLKTEKRETIILVRDKTFLTLYISMKLPEGTYVPNGYWVMARATIFKKIIKGT